MKILFVITSLTRDGAQLALLGLNRGLASRGIASHVVSLGPREGIAGELEAPGVTVTCLDLGRPVKFFRGLFRAVRIARACRADLLVGWMYHGNLAASLLSLAVSRYTPVIWNIRHSLEDPAHDKFRTRVTILLGALASWHPQHIVYNSRRAEMQHFAHGYRSSGSVFIANGIAASVFAPLPAQARVVKRSALPGPKDAVWIGMVARPHPVKDHATLVNAAGMLIKRCPSVRFLLIGRGLEKTGHPVRRLVISEGLEDFFQFRGEIKSAEELAEWIGVLDVAVSASRGEGFPNAIAEAMACGICCVATDAGDTVSLLGGTGRVVPPGDAVALAMTLAEVVEAGDVYRRDQGLAARARVMESFSVSGTVALFADLFEKTVIGLRTAEEIDS